MFSIFRKSDGRILAHVMDGFAETAELGCILGGYSLGTHYVKDGIAKPYPYNPSPQSYVFNLSTEQWEDPRTLADIRLIKRQEIKEARDAFEFGGFDWSGHRFDSDAISQQRIGNACLKAVVSQSTGLPFEQEWTLADNTVLYGITAEQMLAIGMAMAAHIGQAHARSRELQAQIKLAQSIDELNSIAW